MTTLARIIAATADGNHKHEWRGPLDEELHHLLQAEAGVLAGQHRREGQSA